MWKATWTFSFSASWLTFAVLHLYVFWPQGTQDLRLLKSNDDVDGVVIDYGNGDDGSDASDSDDGGGDSGYGSGSGGGSNDNGGHLLNKMK